MAGQWLLLKYRVNLPSLFKSFDTLDLHSLSYAFWAIWVLRCVVKIEFIEKMKWQKFECRRIKHSRHVIGSDREVRSILKVKTVNGRKC